MKAISLWQPWASLIACGVKSYETRSWSPPHELIGQPIAVHAAKKFDKGAAEFAQELVYGQHDADNPGLSDKLAATYAGCPDDLMGLFGMAAMPIGCVVATARLAAAVQVGEPDPTGKAARVVRRVLGLNVPTIHAVPYDEFGDFSPGRWAWLFTNVWPVNPPAPARGAQGFFDLPQGWLCDGARLLP